MGTYNVLTDDIPNNDLEYLALAFRVAQTFSHDPNTQNGAVLTKNKKIIGFGANRFPRGVDEIQTRFQTPLKYKYMAHAESNAVHFAGRRGYSTNNSTLYCPFAACTDCAKTIIQMGIKHVVTYDKIWDWYNEGRSQEGGMDWMEDVKISRQMFKEANVKYDIISGKIPTIQTGPLEIIFRGVKRRFE